MTPGAGIARRKPMKPSRMKKMLCSLRLMSLIERSIWMRPHGSISRRPQRQIFRRHPAMESRGLRSAQISLRRISSHGCGSCGNRAGELSRAGPSTDRNLAGPLGYEHELPGVVRLGAAQPVRQPSPIRRLLRACVRRPGCGNIQSCKMRANQTRDTTRFFVKSNEIKQRT